jgi:hypothetical protein
MFIILAGVLLILGLFITFRGRKALKARLTGRGWIMATIGSKPESVP